MIRRPRGFVWALAAILAAALAVRLVYTIAVAGNGLSSGPSGDFIFFHDLANLLADGEGFISPHKSELFGEPTPTAEHPPLWPLALAAGSEAGGTGVLAHRLVGVPIGVALVGCLGLIGRRLGGDRVGLAVAGIAAAHPLLIAADGSLMSETLYGLWVAVALLLALRLLARPTPATAALMGAAIGLAALTRGEGLVLIPLLALPAAWAAARTARLSRVALAVAAALLVMSPWFVRNWAAFDRPVLTSTNDSTVLRGANCGATYGGRDLGSWRPDCFPAEIERNEAAQAAKWRRDGIEYARDHSPRLVAVVAPVRVLRTWGVWQPARQVRQAEGRDRTVEALGQGFFFLLLPAAVLGAILLRRRGAAVWVILVPPALVTLVTVLAYGYTRFRYAADLSVVVLAGVALVHLADRRGTRRASA